MFLFRKIQITQKDLAISDRFIRTVLLMTEKSTNNKETKAKHNRLGTVMDESKDYKKSAPQIRVV